MGRIPGGTFRMGSDDFYPEERPVHPAQVNGFWMDRHPPNKLPEAAEDVDGRSGATGAAATSV